MKTKRSPKLLQNPKRKNAFAIRSAESLHEKDVAAISSSLVDDKSARNVRPASDVELPAEYRRALVSIATNAWRAKTKMLDAKTGEVRDDMKRVDRHIEAIYRNLGELGIAIRDHTGDVYDEGEPMRVIASKLMPQLQKKCVSETLLPSIFWNNHLVQNGEIEIATPATATSPAEPQILKA